MIETILTFVGGVFISLFPDDAKEIILKRYQSSKVSFGKEKRPYADIEGIVSKKRLDRKSDFKDQAFVIELLESDIELKKNTYDKIIEISINRDNAKYYVITDKGKNQLCQKVVTTDKTRYLETLDEDIQKFITDKDDFENDKIYIECSKDDLTMRWASGGVLPIVRYKNNYYVAAFFRDKKPYGWNIPLGSSQPSAHRKNLYQSLEHELEEMSFIDREFVEEFLVLTNQPARFNYYKSFNVNRLMPDWLESHLKLRKIYDDLTIVPLEKSENNNKNHKITLTKLNTNMKIDILRNGKMYDTEENVLVCFNMFELGIEVVRVYKFDLEEKDYILDGEILEYYSKNQKVSELVRMPVALISCNYLAKVFTDISNIEYYEKGPSATMKIKDEIWENNKLSEKDLIMFNWDLSRRDSIKNDKSGNTKETKRYEESFARYFNKSSDGLTYSIKSDSLRYFTPTTAKILNLFFNNVCPDQWN